MFGGQPEDTIENPVDLPRIAAAAASDFGQRRGGQQLWAGTVRDLDALPDVFTGFFAAQPVHHAADPDAFRQRETPAGFQVFPEFRPSDEDHLLMGDAHRLEVEHDLQITQHVRLQPVRIVEDQHERMIRITGRDDLEQLLDILTGDRAGFLSEQLCHHQCQRHRFAAGIVQMADAHRVLGQHGQCGIQQGSLADPLVAGQGDERLAVKHPADERGKRLLMGFAHEQRTGTHGPIAPGAPARSPKRRLPRPPF
ncbi:MAG TPA: hypothetical protein VFW75_02975 [Acetobacteraceae bacterium]|nr:hypothetical protein [Acetobacteraceae bacterium]